MLADEMRQKTRTITDRVYEKVVKQIDESALDGKCDARIDIRNFSRTVDWLTIKNKLKNEGFYVDWLDMIETYEERTKILYVYWG